MTTRLEKLYQELERLTNLAPIESDCTKEENAMYYCMDQLKEAMFDAGYGHIIHSKQDERMDYTIETLNDSGSGMYYPTKEEFLEEIGLMIDDCIANGGTFFDAQIDSDVSCFYQDGEEE